jgi:hypothetical protein
MHFTESGHTAIPEPLNVGDDGNGFSGEHMHDSQHIGGVCQEMAASPLTSTHVNDHRHRQHINQ